MMVWSEGNEMWRCIAAAMHTGISVSGTAGGVALGGGVLGGFDLYLDFLKYDVENLIACSIQNMVELVLVTDSLYTGSTTTRSNGGL
jgi:hypothetical protein